MKAKGEKFSEFLEKWVSQLEDYKEQLMKMSSKTKTETISASEQDLQALVAKVTTHYKEYYTAKWAAAHEDAFAFFNPIWVSPLENASSWLTGWKPSMAFRLLDLRSPSGVTWSELTEEQRRRIRELRAKVRVEEEKVETDMERQQMSMADRKVVELARVMNRTGGSMGQVEGLIEITLKRLMGGLERVLKAADCVRLKTLKGILEILGAEQSVIFLAAISEVQVQIGRLGKARITHNHNHNHILL